MRVEVLYRVSPDDAERDGSVVEICPPGLFLTPAELADWLDAGREPDLSPLPDDRQAWVRECIAGVLRRRGTPGSPEAAIRARGWDINFGYRSLEAGGVAIMNLTTREQRELLDPDSLAPRRKIPYASLLSPNTLAALRSPELVRPSRKALPWNSWHIR